MYYVYSVRITYVCRYIVDMPPDLPQVCPRPGHLENEPGQRAADLPVPLLGIVDPKLHGVAGGWVGGEPARQLIPDQCCSSRSWRRSTGGVHRWEHLNNIAFDVR